MKGRCVVCGRVGVLTRDHVPPKGVVPPLEIVVRRLTAVIGREERTDDQPRRLFHAPSFPTLCKGCNTERLGKLYDPALVSFANAFAAWVRGSTELGLTLPSAANVDLRPAAVARAVVGHLLAAEERPDPAAPLINGTMLDAMRRYFLATDPFDPGFRVFVWPYAGTDLVIVRGFGMSRVLGQTHGAVVGDVLKFFPVAFWVVGAAPDGVGFPFAEIPLAQEAAIRLSIPLRKIPPRRWPEVPGDNEVVALVRERSHVASRSRRREK